MTKVVPSASTLLRHNGLGIVIHSDVIKAFLMILEQTTAAPKGSIKCQDKKMDKFSTALCKSLAKNEQPLHFRVNHRLTYH